MKTIAIIGGGPSALYLFKHIVDMRPQDISIDLFEAKDRLGHGMPYGYDGASVEHITNISANETPPLETSLTDWVAAQPEAALNKYGVTHANYKDDKVVPRLLFGDYLEAQFALLLDKAKSQGLDVQLHLNMRVTDLFDRPDSNKIEVEVDGRVFDAFDTVILCSGHNWPKKHEGHVPGYFDSPYPPQKLAVPANHPVALRGSSLTAIDAIRTLARANGSFGASENGKLVYKLGPHSPDFKIVMHSKHGLLPCVRTYLEEPLVTAGGTLSDEEVAAHIAANEGFLSLDFIFEEDFKKPLKDKDPAFFEFIRDMRIEEFVKAMMAMREHADPFLLLKAEYEEAKTSMRRKESVQWKETLADLSFAMNYPAKHFSAEDMLRLRKTLLPLISIVIAFVPQNSCEEIMAMHDAGLLDLVSVDADSRAEPQADGGIVYHYKDQSGEDRQIPYRMFVDCIGQPHLPIEAFPFKGLDDGTTISQARLRFRDDSEAEKLAADGHPDIEKDGAYYLKVSGLTIDDSFRSVGADGTSNPRLYLMAVPYIGGFNPDYSGFDFCDEAGQRIAEDMLG